MIGDNELLSRGGQGEPDAADPAKLNVTKVDPLRLIHPTGLRNITGFYAEFLVYSY